jgi:hypothetical protein
MDPIHIKSTDSGAPLLTGQADSLINLLKAILITGVGGAPSAPWSVPYEDAATHTAVFRAPSGLRHYLQVNENAPGAGGQKECRIRGYVTMSDQVTGTEPFPTVAQQANGLFVRKSATADATQRQWRAVFDDKTLYLWIECGDASGTWNFYAFGEFISWKPSNAYQTLIIARYVENSALQTNTQQGGASMSPSTGVGSKIYIPRDYTQVGTAQEIGIVHDSSTTNSVATFIPGSTGVAYPYTLDGGLLMMPYRLALGTLVLGRARGLWVPGHNKPLLHDDVFSSTEGSLTRDFVVHHLLGTGQMFCETSATWDDD